MFHSLMLLSRDLETVVRGEGHGEHILGVRSEAAGGLTTAKMKYRNIELSIKLLFEENLRVQIPQMETLVSRSG